MEINLLRTVKFRVMDELRYAVQKHQLYRDKVKVYHKFPYTERPMTGVVLRNASSSRQRLSADDFAGTLESHFALARAKNHEGSLLEWVWEDPTHMTGVQNNEDLSSQITGTSGHGTNRVFYVQHKPIISGRNNTQPADNFRQVHLTLNGKVIYAELVDGSRGMIMLPTAPVSGDDLRVSYYYKSIIDPGRYYIEMIDDTRFVIDPLYQVKKEKVIARTTGTESTASLDHGNLLDGFDKLYTIKTSNSHKIYLVKNSEYTLDNTSGLITFLEPLPVDTTLYADYRWVGSTMGPYDVPKGFHYKNEDLPGVVLSFSNQIKQGDKMVVIAYDQRETAAKMYSGHFRMHFDIDVFTRDPEQLADLTDHIVQEIWSNRRLDLMREGLTIEEFDPTGESEDVYDENTGDLYYKNSLALEMMTEWKKFVPYLTEILDIDTNLNAYVLNVGMSGDTGMINNPEYVVTNQNRILHLDLLPNDKPFEVKYPKAGYPRYF